jgi:hypothetical protein
MSDNVAWVATKFVSCLHIIIYKYLPALLLVAQLSSNTSNVVQSTDIEPKKFLKLCKLPTIFN